MSQNTCIEKWKFCKVKYREIHVDSLSKNILQKLVFWMVSI